MKNSRLKNGYGLVSSCVVRDPNLSLRDKGLYAYLASYADATSNTLTVSVNKAAAECNVDPSTIRRILEQLRKANVIVRETRGKGQSYKTILNK
jgi:DNA-binding IscR family transcriptional regulator